MRRFVLAALLLSAAEPAFAVSTVSLKNTSCSLSTGCLFVGNVAPNTVADIEAAYNAKKDPDIVLNLLMTTGATFAGNGLLSGTWSLPGYDVDYVAVKAGNQFMLYSTGGASSGTWSTSGLVNSNGNRNPQLGLSHLAFFGSVAPSVPEPAAWAMMVCGFGLLGLAMRRREFAVSFA